MDKLAMEETGYRNCVSVPDGAPSKASPSDKEVPPEEQVCVSIFFSYFYSCNLFTNGYAVWVTLHISMFT